MQTPRAPPFVVIHEQLTSVPGNCVTQLCTRQGCGDITTITALALRGMPMPKHQSQQSQLGALGQAELEAELANEMRAFGIDAAEGRLSDARYRSALAALGRRRREALGRRGRQGAAYANYMHTTLPHYLHQVGIAVRSSQSATAAVRLAKSGRPLGTYMMARSA
jgi:hypothetical protein